jgi:cytochrome c oxidase subunit 1
VIPTVHARDAWWYEKHHQEEIRKEQKEHAKSEAEHGGIHMPFQSIWPFVTSVGILIGAIGVSYFDSNWTPGIHAKLAVTLVGGVIMVLGIYFWAIEGNEGYHLHLDSENEGESEGTKPSAHS